MRRRQGVPLPTPAPRPSRRRSSSPATTPAGPTRSPSSARFHGRSLGSLSLTASKARQRAGFGIVTPGSFHAPYADPYDADALTGADYIEQVLFTQAHRSRPTSPRSSSSRSRARAATSSRRPAGWPTCARLCDEHGILLVIDEVQSGIGRTGTMWACEHDGVEPDIMCIGKGLASGLPLAGIVARADVMDWEPGGHGSTFGGNPVACAAAIATLDLVEDGLAANAADGRRPPARRRCAELQADAAADRAGARSRPDDRHRPARPRHRRRRSSEACFERGLLVLTCGERVDPPGPAARRHRRAGRHRAGDPRRRAARRWRSA